jgi:exportin-1
VRTIKKEILKLVETYVEKAEDLGNVNANLIPPLLEAILIDYRENVEDARDAEVLMVSATISTKLGDLFCDKVPGVFDAIFECTLTMISRNFEDYPEHRRGFYKLLHALDSHCFNGMRGVVLMVSVTCFATGSIQAIYGLDNLGHQTQYAGHQ